MKPDKFVLFLAGPRSGHSWIASAIDAHPNACVGHEQDTLRKFQAWRKGRAKHKQENYDKLFSSPETLFSGIFRADQYFNENGRKTPSRWTKHYDQSIPGQIKENSDGIQVIGNKNGGFDLTVDRYFHELELFQQFIDIPLYFFVVIRSPFDAGHSERVIRKIQHRYYRLTYPKHLIYSEDFIQDPIKGMEDLLNFLELPVLRDHIDNVAKRTLKKRHRSRDRLNHTKSKLVGIARACQEYPLFNRYSLND